ncbi:hypothetical protein [Mesorhizobium sp. M1322]|uniref:hypothetical protein n=1 Tax=Mesorhizobium sp. M1322 TaxID=2957081 RepID=UPI00333C39B8
MDKTNWPKRFGWSKVGGEAGLTVQQILKWKDLQRQLSDGEFFWGVSQRPRPEKIAALLRSARDPQVLFCEQLTMAKPEDREPTQTILWTHFIDSEGSEKELPLFAAVTSRGGPAKSKHVAIRCQSQRPIAFEDISFDSGMFRNIQGGRLGSSQITAIIERSPEPFRGTLYPKGFGLECFLPILLFSATGEC